jgi:hypothetical protein
MGDINVFLAALKNELAALADGSFDKYKHQLMHDGTEFAKKLESDLKNWSAEYSLFEMTKEEFEDLVKSKKDLLELDSLKHEGLPRTELNKLRNAIVETVTATAVKLLL